MKHHAGFPLVLLLALGLQACDTIPPLERCEYSIAQITANSDQDVHPRFDGRNRVIWSGWDGDSELFIYDPASQATTQITNNSRSDTDPRVNSAGHTVWMAFDGNDTEIYLYNGSSVVQITNNSIHDRTPRISDNGAIVWSATTGTSGGTSTNDIFLYDAGAITQITNTPAEDDLHPDINGGGDIVWSGSTIPGGDSEVYVRRGATGAVTQVTNNSVTDCAPRLNEQGDVAWFGGDGSELEAFFRPASSGFSVQLTNRDFIGGCGFKTLDINNSGHAVYSGLAASESQSQVWYFDGSAINQITSGTRSSRDPKLNDDDLVVYWTNAPLAPAGPDDEVYCYDPSTGVTKQVTDDTVSNDVRPEVSADGYVAWEGNDATGNDSEIFLATPAAPDLVVESLTHAPASPTTSQTITFTAVVRNAGSAWAGPSTFNLRVGGETFGQDVAVPALAPGASFMIQRQETLGVAQNYRNTATVDTGDNVAESDEGNNQITDDYTVS